jgi:N-acetylglutamate synthase-like GNAT family acetyltransferase
MQISRLSDDAKIIRQLAAWHVAEWGHLFTDWDESVAHAELHECTVGQTVPAAWVVQDENGLQGSVSLLERDAPELNHYQGPWLASLYVHPNARGRGYGRDLVRAVMQHAQQHTISSVRLFTPKHEKFYTGLGWTLIAEESVHNETVKVMEYRCRA